MSNMIELTDVSFQYDHSEQGALHNVNFIAGKGECVLLCGASGCGKTTITRLINGLIPHFYEGELSGDVTVDGLKIKEEELYTIAAKVGSVFQNPRSQFFCLDTTGEIAFGCENMGLPEDVIRQRIDRVTEELKLQRLLRRNIFKLSGGEKQRVACASVSAMEPDIFVLDEPTSNLDLDAIEELKKALLLWKQKGKTMIIAEHRLYWLKEICDRVVYMEEGRIALDLPMREFVKYSAEKIALLGLRSQDVSYEKPLEDLLDAAFDKYCQEVPWANDYQLSPKSVLRDMLESASDFKGYIQKLGIARSEGILLRYLAEAYRSLDRTVPIEKRDERLRDIISWLGFVVRSVDSSLVDEWENAGNPAALDAAPPQGIDEVVADRRGCTLLVRNALFRRVTLAARGRVRDLGELDEDWGMSEVRWQKALDAYHEQHEEILTNGDARSSAMFTIDESDEKTDHVWHVHQIFADEDGDHDFGIMGDVDLDATQDGGEVIFTHYRVGFIEDLLED